MCGDTPTRHRPRRTARGGGRAGSAAVSLLPLCRSPSCCACAHQRPSLPRALHLKTHVRHPPCAPRGGARARARASLFFSAYISENIMIRRCTLTLCFGRAAPLPGSWTRAQPWTPACSSCAAVCRADEAAVDTRCQLVVVRVERLRAPGIGGQHLFSCRAASQGRARVAGRSAHGYRVLSGAGASRRGLAGLSLIQAEPHFPIPRQNAASKKMKRNETPEPTSRTSAGRQCYSSCGGSGPGALIARRSDSRAPPPRSLSQTLCRHRCKTRGRETDAKGRTSAVALRSRRSIRLPLCERALDPAPCHPTTVSERRFPLAQTATGARCSVLRRR